MEKTVSDFVSVWVNLTKSSLICLEIEEVEIGVHIEWLNLTG